MVALWLVHLFAITVVMVQYTLQRLDFLSHQLDYEINSGNCLCRKANEKESWSFKLCIRPNMY